ncbi:MAG TPA: ABC transporter permease, partial [Gemmatimonadaceae bacterium]|nr:ABC transporter permease [Gemmatimonadaceae bacterium]
PLQMGTMWLTSALMLGYWPLLASGMVSTMIADAFAGERERHTLEALLATRLPDRAILTGKVVAAILYGVLFTLANIALGWAVLLVRYRSEGFLAPPLGQLAMILVLVVLACATVAGVGVFISLRAATVRQAQQTLGIIMMVLFIGPIVAIQMIGPDSRLRLATRLAELGTERVALWAMLVLGVTAIVLNLLALARFRRGKLVLD